MIRGGGGEGVRGFLLVALPSKAAQPRVQASAPARKHILLQRIT